MKYSVVERQVIEVLNDVGFDKWTSYQLRWWIYWAQLAICMVRADAFVTRGQVDLVEGVRQTLPANGVRVFEVFWNTNASGDALTPVTPAKREEMNRVDRLWPTRSKQPIVKRFMHDDRDPRSFDVDPPNNGTGKLEMMYQAKPALYTETDKDKTDDLDDPDLDIDDIYAPAIMDYVLFRAFSRDSIDTPNYQRGVQSLGQCLQMLGIKMNSDEAKKFMEPESADG